MKSFTQTPVLASAALNSTDGEAAVADPRLDPINPHEQAARLARIEEEQVRRDPKSTDEDIAAAKKRASQPTSPRSSMTRTCNGRSRNTNASSRLPRPVR
ncbi:MAG: hypothetical protein IPJ27_18725 [Candidatus Accumulibacter sp.]|uniref:Uncharacterized protein n=1 Tax=Candidatus Accumulibacter proximus TaxID=2954385 RepID=A0A935Q2N5_9PROT|nr:hypothetical protein [Candidatus Accumulibacter proximus]